MLDYWILKRPDGRPAGLVRVEDDRVRLTVTAPVEGSFTLFSDTAAVPIRPETETQLLNAAAVLGTDGDRVTCFAAKKDAAPLQQYRARLSQNRTMSTVQTADAPVPDDLSQIHTKEIEDQTEQFEITDDISQNHPIEMKQERQSITDTAQEAADFSLLLRRADAFFAAYEGTHSAEPVDNLVHKEDNRSDSGDAGLDLFLQEFPGARWRYIEGTDVLAHYEGTWRRPNGQTVHILAVRGRAAPRPPRALLGFTRYLRDRDGTGYWLRLTPLPEEI